jgi:hypothetical protein
MNGDLIQAQPLSFDLTTTAGFVVTGTAAGAPPPGLRCVSLIFWADSNNAATVYFGFSGVATGQLPAGVGGALDAPVGYFYDLSTLTVGSGGTATSGLLVHCLALLAPASEAPAPVPDPA